MHNLERDIDLDGERPKGVPPRGLDGHDDPLPEYESQMGQIITLIDNPEFTDIEEINRLISREIAISVSSATGGTYNVNTKLLNDKVKALRELARTVQEGDNISKKDFLNFDGPKFRYVIGEIVILFRNSMKSGGLAEDVTNHVLRVFRDQLGMRAPELRKETDRITADSLLPELSAQATPSDTLQG